jgi:hypothetical protein
MRNGTGGLGESKGFTIYDLGFWILDLRFRELTRCGRGDSLRGDISFLFF